MAAEAIDEVLSIKIFSPREVYYDGPALTLTASNDTGNFDILPLHHNFITLLKAGTVRVGLVNHTEKFFEIQKGLLRVRNNQAVVFLDV